MNAASPATSGARIANAGRRELVLAAALDTFARYGYRKTSMEDVARAAAISRPGLYLLFGSKQELFTAAVTQALDQSLAAAAGALAGTTRPLRDRLLDAVAAGDVEGDGAHPRPGACELLCRRPERDRVAGVDHDLGAGAGQGPRDGEAYAAARTGDERALAGKSAGTWIRCSHPTPVRNALILYLQPTCTHKRWQAETARGRTAPERKTDRVVKNEVSGARGAQPIRYERSRGLQQFARAIQINRLGTVDHHQIGDGQSGRDLAVE